MVEKNTQTTTTEVDITVENSQTNSETKDFQSDSQVNQDTSVSTDQQRVKDVLVSSVKDNGPNKHQVDPKSISNESDTPSENVLVQSDNENNETNEPSTENAINAPRVAAQLNEGTEGQVNQNDSKNVSGEETDKNQESKEIPIKVHAAKTVEDETNQKSDDESIDMTEFDSE